MSNQQFSVKDNSRVRIRPPRKYDVVFHNDDFTTMDFVIQVLKDVFLKSEIDAFSLMMDVHKSGKAIVGSYSYDIAMSKRDKAMALASAEGFPLKITVEEQPELPF
ncbi:MAG: ATP-dependent Clp protease adaptor ClpS [Muribaculaceae bacterium]|nr:ATP-dependent Clp protease adaptor ClpS [Muribaculaceae bacterium]